MSFLTQKMICRKAQLIPVGGKIPWPRYTTRIMSKKNNNEFPTILGQGAPLLRKHFRPEAACYLYRSTRRVLSLDS